MAAQPLISLVVATLNAARTLPRCLDSLRAQTFRAFEVIVVDGASSDGTVELLRAAGDVVAEWRSAPDGGIYAAWNRALPLARGEWIAFLGADDWLWDAGALERLAPALRTAMPRHAIVYGRIRWIDGAGRLVEELGEPWEACRERFRSHACLPHPGLMHHRSVFEKHGTFDASLKLAADYDLLLRVLKQGDALFVPSVTAGVGWGGRSTRPENFALSLREMELVLRRHGLRPPPLAWAWWNFLARAYLLLRSIIGERGAQRLADLYRVLTLRKPRYAADPPDGDTPAR